MTIHFARMAGVFAAGVGVESAVLGWLAKLPSSTLEWIAVASCPMLLSAVWELVKQRDVQVQPELATLPSMELVTSKADLYAVLFQGPDSIVRGARKTLAAAGGRSRDQAYLAAIAEALRRHEELEYTRVLFGDHDTADLVRHLDDVFELDRQPRALGGRRIRIARIALGGRLPERFIAASEKRAAVIIPSPNAVEEFDSCVVFNDPGFAIQLANHVKNLAGHGEAVDLSAEEWRAHRSRSSSARADGSTRVR